MDHTTIKQIDQTFYDRQIKLGQGKYGKVYLGFCENNKTFKDIVNVPVAVKIIDFDQLTKQSELPFQVISKRLHNEITNLQLVQSENIVRLYDLQQSKKRFYLVCEFCNGCSFDQYLKSKSRLTEPQAMKFLIDIVNGFRHLYSKNIAHRDLKPANLIMHDYTIKIADLGLSKCAQTNCEMLTSIVGTPMYMSPQIYEGQGYTSKTDIWSLGIILYQMLYGEAPWKAKNFQQYKHKIKTEPVRFPSVPLVTGSTKKLIQGMLQHEQEKRVNWEYLFQHPFNKSPNHDSSPYQVFRQYFSTCPVIQSPLQVVRTLTQLGIVSKEQLFQLTHQKYTNYANFFDKYSVRKQNEEKIREISQYYLCRRNRICYLVLLFVESMKFLRADQQVRIQILFQLHKMMFVIMKFISSSLCRMLRSNTEWKQEQVKLYTESSERAKIGKLLDSDLKMVTNFYIDYFKFFSQQTTILGSADPAMLKQLNSELGGLYNNEEGDYSFVKFLMVNAMRTVFNLTKNETHHPSLANVTRLIHEYEKEKRLFELGTSESMRHDLHKKYEMLSQDGKWREKVKKLQNFSTQSVMSYISKEFKWAPMDAQMMQSMDFQI